MKKNHSFSVLKKITSAILAAAALLSVLMLTGCGEKATLDFKELIGVKKISGVNGEGYAVLTTDTDKAMASLGHLNKDSAVSLLNSFKTQIKNENGKLKNGDKLTVTVETDEKLLKDAKVKVTNTELSFDVSGLPVAVKAPGDLKGGNFDKIKALAEEKLNEEITRLTNPETPQNAGEVNKTEIARVLTNSSSVGSGIQITTPKIENVELKAAYMFNADPQKSYYSDNATYDYNYDDGQFFTVVLFTADASYTAYRAEGFFQDAIDQKGTGKYVFAVRLKTPIIGDNGEITSEEIKCLKGGKSEEEIIADLNNDYSYMYKEGVKAK